MAIDLKFGKITVEKNEALSESNEPVFILRAQDSTSLKLLSDYRHRCRVAQADPKHIASIDKVVDAFTKWQKKNSDKVKIPD